MEMKKERKRRRRNGRRIKEGKDLLTSDILGAGIWVESGRVLSIAHYEVHGPGAPLHAGILTPTPAGQHISLHTLGQRSLHIRHSGNTSTPAHTSGQQHLLYLSALIIVPRP